MNAGRSPALCPGSFDPPTNGHIDVIERAARHFDAVVAAVLANPQKTPLFSLDERIAMLEKCLAHVGNVEVAAFDGLLVEFARNNGIRLVVKGVRAAADFDYEVQMAEMNAALEPGLETVFLAARGGLGFLSSSLVKEVARLGADVSDLVPPVVATALRDRLPPGD